MVDRSSTLCHCGLNFAEEFAHLLLCLTNTPHYTFFFVSSFIYSFNKYLFDIYPEAENEYYFE